jgi:hypothetical protein
MFFTHKEMDSEHLEMRNSSTSRILGVGTFIKVTFKKLLTLKNMLHVVDTRMNLIFGSLLRKNGFKLVLKSDKFIISKNRVFIGDEYLSDDLFKICHFPSKCLVPKQPKNFGLSFSFLFFFFCPLVLLSKYFFILIFFKRRHEHWLDEKI